MDCEKTGALIRRLRKEKGLTQCQLATQIQVSDKAVSKWERGQGCPDVSLLPALAQVLCVHLDALMRGDIIPNAPDGGNMKKTQFYVCPVCGNVLTSTGAAQVSCCSKPLDALPMVKASETEKLSVEVIEDEYFVSSDHEMTKEHHISFVALLKGDTLLLRKMYPEWNLETRLPAWRYGTLIWYCTRHGLRYQLLGK